MNKIYNQEDFIVRSRAPLRISLAGGGTDINNYFEKFGGSVLNVTINKYAYAEIQPIENDFIAISVDHDKSFNLKDLSSQEISNLPKELLLHFKVYKKIIKTFNNNDNINCKLITFCDSPVGSGLGSSSTLVVAMIKAFAEKLNLGLDDYEIAELAYSVEREDCNLKGGKQDQYSATFGGFNFIEFHKRNTIVNPLKLKNWFKCELETSLILHFTGISRSSSKVIEDQSNSIFCTSNIALDSLHNIKKEALIMKEAILKCDRESIKNSLRRGWAHKSSTSKKVSNKIIEERIKLAFEYGAEAAKITGAGGGGFLLFMCQPSQSVKLRNKLKEISKDTFFCSFTENGVQAWRIYYK